MAVEHPNGALFVSGYARGPMEQRPVLWSSRDRGASWSRVNVGTEADGAMGNSDVDLALAPDGTLYFATMGFDNAVHEGRYIDMGVSRDAGKTWSWHMLSRDRFDDRPWVKVAPDGTAHVIWNDGAGVRHSVSRDRGATWTELARVHNEGGSSHLAIGPHGELAVRMAPIAASANKLQLAADLIAVSRDGGATWRKQPAPGEREWAAAAGAPEPLPRWVEPLAWDSAGALYSFWTNLKGVWLGRSADAGETWKTWQVMKTVEPAYYPYLIAGHAPGEVIATWFSGRGESLRAHVAVFDTRGDGEPRMSAAEPFAIDYYGPWWAKGEAPIARETGGEYLAAVLLRDGSIGIVSPLFDWRGKREGFSWRKAHLQ